MFPQTQQSQISVSADGWFLFHHLFVRQIVLVRKEIVLWGTQPSTCKQSQHSTPILLNLGSSLSQTRWSLTQIVLPGTAPATQLFVVSEGGVKNSQQKSCSVHLLSQLLAIHVLQELTQRSAITSEDGVEQQCTPHCSQISIRHRGLSPLSEQDLNRNKGQMLTKVQQLPRNGNSSGFSVVSWHDLLPLICGLVKRYLLMISC